MYLLYLLHYLYHRTRYSLIVISPISIDWLSENVNKMLLYEHVVVLSLLCGLCIGGCKLSKPKKFDTNLQ